MHYHVMSFHLFYAHRANYITDIEVHLYDRMVGVTDAEFSLRKFIASLRLVGNYDVLLRVALAQVIVSRC